MADDLDDEKRALLEKHRADKRRAADEDKETPDCRAVRQCFDGQGDRTSVTGLFGWSAAGHPRASSSSRSSP